MTARTATWPFPARLRTTLQLDPVLLGLTEPQLIGLAIIGIGAALWIHYFRAERAGAAARAT